MFSTNQTVEYSCSSNQSRIQQHHKQSLENPVHSPLPQKRKVSLLKPWNEIIQIKGPISTRSFNKLEEFIRKDDSYPPSPLKTEKNSFYQQEYQTFSSMIKSDELFNKSKQIDLQQLRNQTKNPLGKEEFFPEKSFENLKFIRNSLSQFEELNQLENQEESDDLLLEKELELLKELSINN